MSVTSVTAAAPALPAAAAAAAAATAAAAVALMSGVSCCSFSAHAGRSNGATSSGAVGTASCQVQPSPALSLHESASARVITESASANAPMVTEGHVGAS